MTAVHTPFGVYSSMSFISDDVGLTNVSFHSSAAEGLPQTIPSTQSNNHGPLPLPSFVFPAKASPSSAPTSSRSAGRRPHSMISLSSYDATRMQTGRDNMPILAFDTKLDSLSVSPHISFPRTDPYNTGSGESVNEKKSSSAAKLFSTPVIVGEAVAAIPTAASTVRRRGHAHRRSAAISCGDLSFTLKPDASIIRGSSAPNSPNFERLVHPFPNFIASKQQPAVAEAGMPASTASDTPPKALKCTRVGFSDDVQIIPRPLSSLSSDSASTVLPGHSVSNSLSSVMSTGANSPAKDHLLPIIRADTRPRTAEPIVDREDSKEMRHQPKRSGSLPLLVDAAGSSPLPSTPRSVKRWSFFGHETISGDSSPRSRPTSAASSSKELVNDHSAASSLPIIPNKAAEAPSQRRSSLSKKPSKKQKKVKLWAGSILSRKSRQRSQKQKISRRTPTPPQRSCSLVIPEENLQTSDLAHKSPRKTEPCTDFANWVPRKLSSHEETLSPVIDLDAALGPFNTPTAKFGDDWDYSQKGTTRKKIMHSAAGLGGFSGPGMHYHRRAESAPEFENPRFGLHRLGSSSTMAMEDVFEEDENEEWEDTKASDQNPDSRAGDAEPEVEAIREVDTPAIDPELSTESASWEPDENKTRVKWKGTRLSEGDGNRFSSTRPINSPVSFVDTPIVEEDLRKSVEISYGSIPPRKDSGAQSSDSTCTPSVRPGPGKELATAEAQTVFHVQNYQPTSPLSTTQSSIPSPHSPFSYDIKCISTAPSSIVEENGFESLLLGEPGPELRMSVDDVPSLTSSNSTMTRESAFNPTSTNNHLRDGQRSSSFSSAMNRKRSSIASLSRLISSSHGERSKLSNEYRAPSNAECERKEKNTKGKRSSRFMKFLKKLDIST